MTQLRTIDGATFRLHLQALLRDLKDDDQVYFGAGDLTFNRFKDRGPVEGPGLINMEFVEMYEITSSP